MNVFGNQRFNGSGVFSPQSYAASTPTRVFADQRAGNNAVFGEQLRAARRTALRTFGVQRAGSNAVFGEQVLAQIDVDERRQA